MQEGKIQELFSRANNLHQEHLVKITILNREYWVCGQDLCSTEMGQMIKLDLATKFYEDYYCAILVTPEEFEILVEKKEREQEPLHERVWDVIKTGPDDASEVQNILFEVYFALERNNNVIEPSIKDLESIRLKYQNRINGNEAPIVHKMIARINSAIEKLQTISEWC